MYHVLKKVDFGERTFSVYHQSTTHTLEEAEKFYNSVQEAREIIDTDFRTLNNNEAYRLVSHLEPNVEDEYKVDLDQFLSALPTPPTPYGF